jgi:Trk K+ transport system NAD-binding subunit
MLLVYNWNTVVLFAIIVFLIRPIGVFLSTYGSNLKLNERVFISWVGPRGIVAAGIASLFGLKLTKSGVEGAQFITPLVFMVVLGTVLLNATTARIVSKMIGVFLVKSEGILIVGASQVSRLIGRYLEDNGRHVVLIDSNQTNIQLAREQQLEAINADIYSESLEDNIELNDVGFLMALTGSADINKYAIEKFSEQFGENGTFRLISADEMDNPENSPKEGLFSQTDDFISLTEVARKFPQIHEMEIKDRAHYETLIELTNKDADIIPLLVKDKKGVLEIISSHNKAISKIERGYKLVYLGKPIDQ